MVYGDLTHVKETNMKNFLSNYSNGWGHLIMSVSTLAFVAVLIVFGPANTPKDTLTYIAIGVATYWFGSGVANRFNLQTSTPAQVIIPAPGTSIVANNPTVVPSPGSSSALQENTQATIDNTAAMHDIQTGG